MKYGILPVAAITLALNACAGAPRVSTAGDLASGFTGPVAFLPAPVAAAADPFATDLQAALRMKLTAGGAVFVAPEQAKRLIQLGFAAAPAGLEVSAGSGPDAPALALGEAPRGLGRAFLARESRRIAIASIDAETGEIVSTVWITAPMSASPARIAAASGNR